MIAPVEMSSYATKTTLLYIVPVQLHSHLEALLPTRAPLAIFNLALLPDLALRKIFLYTRYISRSAMTNKKNRYLHLFK